MHTHKKKEGKKESVTRSLKIQPQLRYNGYDSTTVPQIKLCGNWLKKLGFAPNQRISVETKKKRLIIRVEE